MFPELKTDRLILRKILPEDKHIIFEGLSNKKVIEYYGISFTKFEDVQIQMDWFEDLLKNETGIWWGIAFKDSKELIGACGFNDWQKEHKKSEIGAWLLPEYWGKSIIVEAINKISEYAFNNMAIHRIEGVVETNNTKCKRLLDKLSFVYEGTLKDAEIKDGKYISLDYYSKINKKEKYNLVAPPNQRNAPLFH